MAEEKGGILDKGPGDYKGGMVEPKWRGDDGTSDAKRGEETKFVEPDR